MDQWDKKKITHQHDHIGRALRRCRPTTVHLQTGPQCGNQECDLLDGSQSSSAHGCSSSPPQVQQQLEQHLRHPTISKRIISFIQLLQPVKGIYRPKEKEYPHLSFLLGGRSSSILLLATNLNTVVLQVPLLERSSIDLNNSTLDKRLGPDELVVGSVVDNIKNPGLAGHCFTSPRVVTSVEPQRTPLDVASTDSDSSHRLVAGQLGVGWLPSHLVPNQNTQSITNQKKQSNRTTIVTIKINQPYHNCYNQYRA